MAGSNRTGIPFRNLFHHQLFLHSDYSVVRTGHADIGDIGRALGKTRSSAVGTCVCVPTTAVTRPSRYQPIEIFSEVASAWKSTKITLASICFKKLVGSPKRIVIRSHKHTSLQVNHRVRDFALVP